jgi:hypothetical protein
LPPLPPSSLCFDPPWLGASRFFPSEESTWLAMTPRRALTILETILRLPIVYTLIAPAPLNSRIAHWDLNALPPDWKQMRRRWDAMHAIRCVFLVVALVLLVVSLVM